MSQPESVIPRDIPSSSPVGWQFIGVVFALGAILLTATHMVMCFLHVAPTNAISQRYGRLVNMWIYPWFEQNWSMFAPNPVSWNEQVFARTYYPSGRESAWFDLTAADYAAIRGNIWPTHYEQNEMRRAWDGYVQSHDIRDNSISGPRGELLAQYLRNVAVQRVAGSVPAGFNDIQIRTVIYPVRPPGATADPVSSYRILPWWPASGAVIGGDLVSGPVARGTLGSGR